MVEYEPQGANSNTENPAKKLSESPLSKLQKTIKCFQQLNKCLVVVQRPRLQVPNAEGPGSSRGEGATLWLQCTGFSLQWFLLLLSVGWRDPRALDHRLSSCDAHRISCSEACGIFPDQRKAHVATETQHSQK